MKRIEKLAIVVMVLFFASWAAHLWAKFFVNEIIDTFHWPVYAVMFLSIPLAATYLAVNICIAIWLFVLTRKERAMPWVWSLFGLVFGLLAPILFYVMKIHNRLGQPEKTEGTVADSQ